MSPAPGRGALTTIGRVGSAHTRLGRAGDAVSEELVEAAEAALAGPSGGSAVLPRVVGEAPVAVLLIDRGTGEVTYGNTAALRLAGDLELPLGTDAWADAVGLTDLDGHPLSGTDGPLSAIATGLPVAGEAVRAPGADGGPEQVLWVTGFPLGPGVDGLDLSLVVLLAVDEGPDAATGLVLQSLRDRAVVATDICFTISDPRRPGNPLVWVNPSFTRVTGYSAEEALGRNCSFLQGPATDPAVVAEIRAGIAARRQTTVTLLNHRKDGTAFWNQLSISPVFDRVGELTGFVGVQSDVTARVLLEAERAAAHAAERTARRDAEAAQERLRLMAEATTLLAGTLDTGELLDRLAGLCVPSLADWVFIARLDGDGVVDEVVVHHTGGDPAHLQDVRSAFLGRHLPESSPAYEAVRTGGPVVVRDLRPETLQPFSRGLDPRMLAELGTRSLLAVPLPARGGTRGVMTLVRAIDDGFSASDVGLAVDLGTRAGLALDNARLYEQEASVAEALQRSLLPELPAIDGVTGAAHYTSASAAAAVGGDFYDLLALPGDRIGMVIGDVAGHDLNAAATMGQLRGLLRAGCWDLDAPDPAVVLGRVDRLLDVLDVPGLATTVLLRADRPADGGPWRVECSNAGHPPVLVRGPDGSVRPLTEEHDLLLGAAPQARRRTAVVEVEPGSLLIGFTDGLIEQPGAGGGPARDVDSGTAALVGLLAGLPVGLPAPDVCEAMTALVSARLDDVACLVVALH